MTEENSNTKEATVESTQATPGQQLKRGREAMGLTQQQVADRLHLRLGNIQDIETDTHQPGVSITFTKGYVRIYAKLLGMPVEPLLEAFDILHQGEKQPAKLQSFSQRVAKQANDDRWMMVTYLIVFLVIASLVIWWYQQSDKSIMNRLNLFSDTTTEQAKSNNIDEGQAVNAMSNNLAMPDELATPEEDIKNQNVPSNVSDTIVDNEINKKAVTVANQAQTSSESVNEVIAKATDALPDTDSSFSDDASEDFFSTDSQSINGYAINSDGTVDVVFTFKEDCWLSVTDANDKVMAVGVKIKGRVMSVSGVPPISVNMCPPNIVDIAFAGVPVDLSKYPRGFPVKFELSVKGE